MLERHLQIACVDGQSAQPGQVLAVTGALQRLLHTRIGADVADRGHHEGQAVVLQRAERDLDHDLTTVLAFGQHTRPVQQIQMLGQVGLGGVDFLQQLGNRFLSVAQGAEDAQAHGRGQHAKQLGGHFEHAHLLDIGIGLDHLFHGRPYFCQYKHGSYLQKPPLTMRFCRD
ncbi:hypothetical protein D9M68_737410 [compost metagenome]